MKEIPKLFSNKHIMKAILYGHIAATILGVILFFTGTSNLYAILGSHIVIYPILGLAVAAALESIVLVGVFFIYWAVTMTALAVGWYSAVKRASYRTLLMVSAADVIFSAFVLILSVCVGDTFTSLHALMIAGVVLSAVFCVYLFFLHRFTKPKEEAKKA